MLFYISGTVKLLEFESPARDREKSTAEAHAQHYVIMIAGPRKMKGHLMQPLGFLSDCSAQMGTILYEMRYTKAGGK